MDGDLSSAMIEETADYGTVVETAEGRRQRGGSILGGQASLMEETGDYGGVIDGVGGDSRMSETFDYGGIMQNQGDRGESVMSETADYGGFLDASHMGVAGLNGMGGRGGRRVSNLAHTQLAEQSSSMLMDETVDYGGVISGQAPPSASILRNMGHGHGHGHGQGEVRYMGASVMDDGSAMSETADYGTVFGGSHLP
ncbi:hypothetical protein KIPB_011513, partial [Kipferlia bialata]|eukprot:g11513.t1